MGEMQMQIAKYTAEFEEEAVRQVIDRGYSVVDEAKRLGIGDGLLYTWVKKFKAANEPAAIDGMESMQEAELNRVEAKLRRTTEACDILKKAAAYFAIHSKYSTRLSRSIACSSISLACAGC
jgi:transposase